MLSAYNLLAESIVFTFVGLIYVLAILLYFYLKGKMTICYIQTFHGIDPYMDAAFFL
jgi:hypothetical protein